MFVELILRAAEQREVPIFIVSTMRSDFVGDAYASVRRLRGSVTTTTSTSCASTREQIVCGDRGSRRASCCGVLDPALVD